MERQDAPGNRRISETGRREADARFEAIFNHAFNGMVLAVAETGVLTSANPAFLRMTGYTEAQLPRLRLDQLHPCDTGTLAADRVSSRHNVLVARHDGSLFHADITGTPIRMHGTDYLLCEFCDITERLAAQAALRELQSRHQRIYDSMREALAMVDMSGRIVESNQAFQDLVGYSAEELQHMTYPELTPARWHAPEQRTLVEEVLVAGESRPYEKEYIRKDGSIVPVELKTVLLRDARDQPEMMWAIIRDISERKQTEASLRESEERFRSLLANIPSVAVQGYAFDGTTQYWNRASERLYGYTAEEAVGRNLLDLIIPPDIADNVRSAIARMTETGEHIPASELTLRHKDGSPVDVFSSHAIVRIPGRPPEMFCIDIDLSHIRKADAKRRKTKRRLTMALQNSPVAVFEQATDLRYTWSFNHLKDGYTADELLGKTDADLLELDAAERLTVLKRSVLETGQPVRREMALSRPGGPVEHYELHLEPRTDAKGRIIGLIGSAIDITRLTEQQKELSNALAQRQWTEAVLREREEQLALFVEYAPASIAMFDTKMRYLAASRRWMLEHGIAGRDIRGYCHYDLLPEQPEHWRQVHARCLAGSIEHCNEDSFISLDGVRRTIRWEVRPWSTSTREIGGIIIFSEDITEITEKRNELAKSKAAAEKANAAKSHFLAAASHDLRQPLHALDLYLGIIADSVPATHADIIANMRQCSSNLSNLLNELLDLSRLDAGAVKPRMQDFDLAGFLDQIATTHAPSAEQKDLLFRVARTSLTARTDPGLLQQLVANLVGNAIRYTDRGSVLIGIRRRQGKLWIEVWDTGIGIPEDMQEEIFEPFRQLGNPERNREAGTGLGLALVRQLADLLGLQIRLASRPGHGSMFAVEVPRGRGNAAGSEADSEAPQPGIRHLRIALVEDDPQVREATQRSLAHFGHAVIAAPDTPGLLTQLAGTAPDLIIADHQLAGNVTGPDCIAAVRDHFGATIKAVIITGNTRLEVLKDIAGSGIPVLNKPLSFNELKRLVTEVSEQPAPGALPSDA